MTPYSQAQGNGMAKESFAAEAVGSSLPSKAGNQQTPSSSPKGTASSGNGASPVSVGSSKDPAVGPDGSKPQESAVPGMEPIDGYVPVGTSAESAHENSPDVEEPFSLIDAHFADSSEARELAAALFLHSQAPAPRDTGQGQERRRRLGKFLRKLGGWLMNRPRLFESGALPNGMADDVQEVVNGVDDRVPVDPATNNPWSGIVSLNIQAAHGGRYIGTGWLIAPRTVITAGHCVYLHDAGGWPTEITLSAGRNGSSHPYGKRVSSHFSAPSGWIDHSNRAEDYGVIFLDEPFSPVRGETPFIFPFAAKDSGDLLGNVLNLSGYPGGDPLTGKDGTNQYYHGRTASEVTDHTVGYDIDTSGGQSGSPVWLYNPSGGTREVVGIHTNGFPYANSATRITIEMEGLFEEWRAAGL